MNTEKLLPLVEKSIEGDEQAYADLCEAIIRDVLYVCIKITGDLQSGEDAAQEALIRLGNSIKKLRNPQAFPLWLNRHITGSCRDYLRREKRQRYELDEDLYKNVLESNTEFLPAEWAESQEQRRLVLSSLQQMPARQQHILLMYYFQEMSTKDIAAANNITESAVRSNLQYARNNLKRRIEKSGGAPLDSLTGMASVPTLTAIFYRDAASLVTQESAKKVLLTTGAAAGGGATLAGVQIATMVAGVAPAAVAVALAIASTIPFTGATPSTTNFVSSPSPSVQPSSSVLLPPSSEVHFVQDEGEGGLYIQQSSLSQATSIPQASSTAEWQGPDIDIDKEPIPFIATGTLTMADINGRPVQHEALSFAGVCVQAFKEGALETWAYADAEGNYTLHLPDSSVAYTIRIANNTLPGIGQQEQEVYLAPGTTQVPNVSIVDKQKPSCSMSFTDAAGITGALVNPNSIEIEVFDATPCDIVWKIAEYTSAAVLDSGSGCLVLLEGPLLAKGKYSLDLEITDLCGNTIEVQRVFYMA